jgi:outer membrane protein assembly factor BamE (lipoprotein component of BamABCDE complex)
LSGLTADAMARWGDRAGGAGAMAPEVGVKEIGMKASMRPGRLAMVATLGLAVGLSGCARIKGHQGYVMDNALVASVQPGVDNRESVLATLGDPSFPSEFDPTTWYYVSRTTRQFSFGVPRPIAETAVAVHFDRQGVVSGVERTGLNRIVSVRLVNDTTPTLGRKRSVFQELFGNIGAVGGIAPNAPTTDNPTGSTTP